MRIYFALLVFSFVINIHLQAQSERIYSNNELGFQYGFSLKGLLEFSLKKNTQKPVFKLCSDLGLGSNVFARGLYFSINTELQLYNGGLGSRRRNDHKKPFLTLDFISAFTLTTGISNYLSKTVFLLLLVLTAMCRCTIFPTSLILLCKILTTIPFQQVPILFLQLTNTKPTSV